MLKMLFYCLGLIIFLTGCDDCSGDDLRRHERSERRQSDDKPEPPILKKCHEIYDLTSCNALSNCTYFEDKCIEKQQVNQIQADRKLFQKDIIKACAEAEKIIAKTNPTKEEVGAVLTKIPSIFFNPDETYSQSFMDDLEAKTSMGKLRKELMKIYEQLKNPKPMSSIEIINSDKSSQADIKSAVNNLLDEGKFNELSAWAKKSQANRSALAGQLDLKVRDHLTKEKDSAKVINEIKHWCKNEEMAKAFLSKKVLPLIMARRNIKGRTNPNDVVAILNEVFSHNPSTSFDDSHSVTEESSKASLLQQLEILKKASQKNDEINETIALLKSKLGIVDAPKTATDKKVDAPKTDPNKQIETAFLDSAAKTLKTLNYILIENKPITYEGINVDLPYLAKYVKDKKIDLADLFEKNPSNGVSIMLLAHDVDPQIAKQLMVKFLAKLSATRSQILINTDDKIVEKLASVYSLLDEKDQKLFKEDLLNKFIYSHNVDFIKSFFDQGIFKVEDKYTYTDPQTKSEKEGNFITAVLIRSGYLTVRDEILLIRDIFFSKLKESFKNNPELFTEVEALKEEINKNLLNQKYTKQLSSLDDTHLIETIRLTLLDIDEHQKILCDFLNKNQEKKYLLPRALSQYYNELDTTLSEDDAKAIFNGQMELPNLRDDDDQGSTTQPIKDFILKWRALNITI